MSLSCPTETDLNVYLTLLHGPPALPTPFTSFLTLFSPSFQLSVREREVLLTSWTGGILGVGSGARSQP